MTEYEPLNDTEVAMLMLSDNKRESDNMKNRVREFPWVFKQPTVHRLTRRDKDKLNNFH